jgi:hypothetical protein
VRINREEILQLFDKYNPKLKGNISSIIAVVGEDLGVALFQHFCKTRLKCSKIDVSTENVNTGKNKGPRLDRWIYVYYGKKKCIAYQTEIKNWSVYAVDQYSQLNDSNFNKITRKAWTNCQKRLLSKKRWNKENKVLCVMKKPKDFPLKAVQKPLIIYWFAFFNDKYEDNPFFPVKISRGSFGELYVFSMSNYLRMLDCKVINLNMPVAEKRISWIKKYFKKR